MTTEVIEEKIRKLLALAANNPSKEESASALAKAQALMTEHKIEQATLDTAQTVEEKEIFTSFGANEGVTRAYWKLSLSTVLGAANGVFNYKSGRNIGIVGKPSNIRAMSYMFSYCIAEIERLSKLHCKGLGHSYANDFKRGCVNAISNAIESEHIALQKRMREQAAASNNERSLIVLNNAIAKVNNEFKDASKFAHSQIKFVNVGYTGTRVRTSVYSEGQKAGSSIYPGSRAKIGNGSSKLLN